MAVHTQRGERESRSIASAALTVPALIRTAGLGTEVLGSVNGPGASGGRGHRVGWRGRGRLGMRRVLLTGSAGRLVAEPSERVGLSGAFALWWGPRGSRRAKYDGV